MAPLCTGHMRVERPVGIPYTNDPTKIVVIQDASGKKPVASLVLRIHCEHVEYPILSMLIALLERYFIPAGIGIDNGGNGGAVLQELLALMPMSGCHDDERTELAADFDDLQQVRHVVGGGQGHQEVVQDEDARELQPLERLEDRPVPRAALSSSKSVL